MKREYLSQAQSKCHSLQLSPREVGDLLIKEVVQLKRFDDVCHKLRVDVGVSDLAVQQLLDTAGELGADLLWLVADVHPRHFN